MALSNENNFLVRLTTKFANRVFHEFHPDHPHKTAQGGELLVTNGTPDPNDPTKDVRRIVEAARTPGVNGAIMQGILEEVRSPNAQPSPVPQDVLDTVNGVVKPGYPAAADGSAPAADDAATTETSAATGKGSK
jgi:hypothetical protein